MNAMQDEDPIWKSSDEQWSHGANRFGKPIRDRYQLRESSEECAPYLGAPNPDRRSAELASLCATEAVETPSTRQPFSIVHPR
jgi:hypothetical protein